MQAGWKKILLCIFWINDLILKIN